MICEKTVKQFCCEDISLIENYNKAINDTTQTWQCHHRLETDLGLSQQELEESNRYYGVEAKYLIFLTKNEHMSLHQKLNNNFKYRKDNGWIGKRHSNKDKLRISASSRKPKPRYKYLTPSGEIIEMPVNIASRYHKDWIKIGEV